MRDDIYDLAARHAALEAEVAEKQRERDAAHALLQDAKRVLPVLDNIRVARPCRADWNQMTGDDRVRHCGSCNKRVYNLSEMTREAAQALLTEKEGKLCARYYQRADGTIVLADCVITGRTKLAIAGAALALGAGAAYAVLHRTPSQPPPPAIDLSVAAEAATPSARATTHENAPPEPVARGPVPEPASEHVLQGDVSFGEITE